jgi:phosphohistidine phosphatase
VAAALRRLVLLRHAKAEGFAASDHERRLTERGLADAAAAGRWLAEQGLRPDHVLASDARRTQQTAAAVLEAVGQDLPDEAVEASPALYAADVDTALDLLRELPEDAATVLVVGHNPTISVVSALLDDGTGDAAAAAEAAGGHPTAALAVLEVDGSWADLGVAGARLVAFHAARA